MKPAATLLKGAVCRTNVKHRPNPTVLLFPGLAAKPFHNPIDFPWVKALASNLDVIRKEFLDLQASPEAKSDYDIKQGEHTLHDGKWQWYSFISKGSLQAEMMSRCPKTAEILMDIPSIMTGIPFAYSFFSVLPPGSKISAHCGPSNLRVRCHFPLIVPPGCGLRVGDEVREWKEGECLLFDDSYEHEVWHNGSSDRVVLLLDVWHPDLDPLEIAAVQGMFSDAKAKGWIT